MAIGANELATRQGGMHAPAFEQARSFAENSQTQHGLDLEAMLNSAVDGILVADVETKHFVFANTAICEMLGYTREAIRSLGVQDIHPPEALPSVQRHFETDSRNQDPHGRRP